MRNYGKLRALPWGRAGLPFCRPATPAVAIVDEAVGVHL